MRRPPCAGGCYLCEARRPFLFRTAAAVVRDCIPLYGRKCLFLVTQKSETDSLRHIHAVVCCADQQTGCRQLTCHAALRQRQQPQCGLRPWKLCQRHQHPGKHPAFKRGVVARDRDPRSLGGCWAPPQWRPQPQQQQNRHTRRRGPRPRRRRLSIRLRRGGAPRLDDGLAARSGDVEPLHRARGNRGGAAAL